MPKNILVMEDDEDIRGILSTILGLAGYDVQACVNGKDGIELFKVEQFDLVITDITMPVMDGIEVIKRIRGLNDMVPIIAMSGVDRSKSFLDIADYYTADITVAKPFSAKQILRAVKDALDKQL